MEIKYSIQENLIQRSKGNSPKKSKRKWNIKGGIVIAKQKETEEALKPTNDYVFKRIFGHVGNEKITKGLINSILSN